jgi:hypothetical protein
LEVNFSFGSVFAVRLRPKPFYYFSYSYLRQFPPRCTSFLPHCHTLFLCPYFLAVSLLHEHKNTLIVRQRPNQRLHYKQPRFIFIRESSTITGLSPPDSHIIRIHFTEFKQLSQKKTEKSGFSA